MDKYDCGEHIHYSKEAIAVCLHGSEWTEHYDKMDDYKARDDNGQMSEQSEEA